MTQPPQALYPCSSLHTLSFQFGGVQFPVDPRDFLSAAPSIEQTDPGKGNEQFECDATANLVSTDPPSVGALFSWSLGDTFLKSFVLFLSFLFFVGGSACEWTD